MADQVAVGFDGENFKVQTPFFLNHLAKNAPDRKWDPKDKVWVLPLHEPNRAYIEKNFKPEQLSEKAQHAIAHVEHGPDYGHFPADWDWPLEPMKHQVDAVRAAFPYSGYALFHEMGLGKTYAAITLASARWAAGHIDAVLVICPNSIKSVWERELVKFGSDSAPIRTHVHRSTRAQETATFVANDDKGIALQVLITAVESYSTGQCYDLAESFTKTRRTMVIVDESSKIKNFKAKRTEKIHSLGQIAAFRLIMTGTSVTQGIHDLYSQFAFLDWAIIGQKSFYTFRNRYCVMEPVPGQPRASRIVGYTNVDELMERIKPYTHQRLKEDCLDLPPKVYEDLIIEPSEEQKSATRSLKKQMVAEFGDKKIEVSMALDMLLRFQQIAGGFAPYIDGYDERDGRPLYAVEPLDKNPKLDALMDFLEGVPIDKKVIIWARFVHEIEAIAETINQSQLGGLAGMFYGKTSEEDRARLTELFQSEDKGNALRFMVANQSVGGMGQTWTAANIVVYYSDSFSYEDRVQSEDRAHRKGQLSSVTYINLTMGLPVDRRIRSVLDNKGSMADFVKDAMTEDILTWP